MVVLLSQHLLNKFSALPRILDSRNRNFPKQDRRLTTPIGTSPVLGAPQFRRSLRESANQLVFDFPLKTPTSLRSPLSTGFWQLVKGPALFPPSFYTSPFLFSRFATGFPFPNTLRVQYLPSKWVKCWFTIGKATIAGVPLGVMW